MARQTTSVREAEKIRGNRKAFFMEPKHIKHTVELIKEVYFITSSQGMSGKSFLHCIILSPKEGEEV